MTVCGIYVIRCIENQRAYVGQAINVGKRLREHRRLLSTGKHHNKHLQSSWSKYGADAFTFSVCLRCQPTELTRTEQRVADLFKRRYQLFNVGEYTDCPVRGLPNPMASEMMRAKHQDPEFAARRDRRAVVNASALKTQKAVAAFKAKMGVLYADPDYVAYRAEIMRNTLDKPGFRELIAKKGSATMSKLWEDPEFAERTTDRMRAQNADPEFTAKRVTALSKKHKDAEFTKARLAASFAKRARKVVHKPSGKVFASIEAAASIEPKSTINLHLSGKVKVPRWGYVTE